MIWILKI